MGAAKAVVLQSTDVELVAAAQKGDYDAFEVLVERHQDRVYRLAYGFVQSASDAEDVTQETFLSVFTHLATFRASSAPASWIHRITANHALMRLRARRRRPVMSIEDRPSAWNDDGKVWIVPPGDWAQTPDDALLSRELGQRIESAVDKLPESYRVVLLMRDVEGLSSEEVASALGVTIATVKNRLHRSRLFVRDELEGYFRL